MPLPAWVTVGAPVVILRQPTHATPSLTRVTVWEKNRADYALTDALRKAVELANTAAQAVKS